MQGVVSLDNSVRAEIHGNGDVGLDCLVKIGSYSVSLDDLSIRNCMFWKKDYTFDGVVH
jgi:hypothetical protein